MSSRFPIGVATRYKAGLAASVMAGVYHPSGGDSRLRLSVERCSTLLEHTEFLTFPSFTQPVTFRASIPLYINATTSRVSSVHLRDLCG
jgi:hypothetical protein